MANYSSGAKKRADENNEEIAGNDSVQKKTEAFKERVSPELRSTGSVSNRLASIATSVLLESFTRTTEHRIRK